MLGDRTDDIRGDNSIYRLLKGAMWLVDERYWLMHSDEALRTIVGRQLRSTDGIAMGGARAPTCSA